MIPERRQPNPQNIQAKKTEEGFIKTQYTSTIILELFKSKQWYNTPTEAGNWTLI